MGDDRERNLIRRLVLVAVAVSLTVAAPAAAVARGGVPGRLPTPHSMVQVIITTADLDRKLTYVAPLAFSTKAPRGEPIIRVDEHVRYQTIKGVGGAMTDTSAWLLEDRLPPGRRAWLMRQLFAPTGLHLRFIRVPIGASDYTSTGIPYTYDDLPPGQTDPTLAHFSVMHDAAYIIPALRDALSLDRNAFVLATPWSPPAWMKTNGILGNPFTNMGWLRRADFETLAQYIVKFLQAYAAAGVHVNAITPQNEPGQTTTYPGMNLAETGEATFIHDYLVPALRAAGLRSRIYGYDNNWYNLGVGYAHALERSLAGPDLAGISSHCYFGVPTVLAALHEQAPNLDEIVSECSPGNLPFSTSELEIAAIRNWASAVALWNLALDQTGGPVQPPNSGCLRCTPIVTINDHTQRVTFTRDYYQLGQLSKFVRPGAVRIESNNFVTYEYFPEPSIAESGRFATYGLDDVAFINPGGDRVLLAYNSSAAPIAFGVENDRYYFDYRLAPEATVTLVWPAPTGRL